jgi:hypothetical protein
MERVASRTIGSDVRDLAFPDGPAAAHLIFGRASREAGRKSWHQLPPGWIPSVWTEHGG